MTISPLDFRCIERQIECIRDQLLSKVTNSNSKPQTSLQARSDGFFSQSSHPRALSSTAWNLESEHLIGYRSTVLIALCG